MGIKGHQMFTRHSCPRAIRYIWNIFAFTTEVTSFSPKSPWGLTLPRERSLLFWVHFWKVRLERKESMIFYLLCRIPWEYWTVERFCNSQVISGGCFLFSVSVSQMTSLSQLGFHCSCAQGLWPNLSAQEIAGRYFISLRAEKYRCCTAQGFEHRSAEIGKTFTHSCPIFGRQGHPHGSAKVPTKFSECCCVDSEGAMFSVN